MESNIKNTIRSTFQYVISILVIGLVAVVCYFLAPWIGYISVAMLLLLTVSILAIFFNTLPVLIAAVISALTLDYFFIPPKFTFHVNSAEDALILAMYFVIALLNAVLSTQIRLMEKEATKREEKTKTIKLYNTLLNSLSHELRTPISTIMGASDNLASNHKLSDEDKSYLLSQISMSSERLNRQVENLLNVSRIESGFIKPKKDWCDINELVYSATNDLQQELTHHRVKINIPANLPLFKLDFGLMRQALYNLIDNAIRYTPPGTTIEITAAHLNAISGRYLLEEGAVERNRKIELLSLVISDNGKGFPPDKIGKAFDKFYRVDQHITGGSGLGLSIVKGFVQAHYGSIVLENNRSGGATFAIEIPTEITYINQLKNE